MREPACLSYMTDLPTTEEWEDVYYWQVVMPKPKGSANTNDELSASNADTEVFILFKHISLLRGEVIVGRATRIWKAWRRSQMHLNAEDREVRFFCRFPTPVVLDAC